MIWNQNDIGLLLQHPEYDFPSFDIAILFIDGDVEADGFNVSFATLAPSDSENFVGSFCEMAGWGLDESKYINIIY